MTSNALYTKDFDTLIQSAAGQYLSPWDWRWLKAELICESDLDPKARAGDGGMGLAQFMPHTWEDVVFALGFPKDASAFDPQFAVPGAAFYLGKIRSWWAGIEDKRYARSEIDRRRLVQASYNAGFGNVSRAARLAGASVVDFATIGGTFLPEVTSKGNAAITVRYVARIEKTFLELGGVMS